VEGEKMSKICFITGKSQVKGNRIRRRGQTKKSGGIGTHVIKRTRRVFKANLQRVRIVLPSGEVRRVLVCVKAIKAGKVRKAA
jgi:large subunit ribosomal protein L28